MAEVRPRLGAHGLLDDDALLAYLEDQRWFGAHGRHVQSAEIVEAIRLSEDPGLDLALVDVSFEAGTHELYQLLLRERDGALFDATADPLFGMRLVELTATQALRESDAGRVTFNAIRPIEPPSAPEARALGGEQTNTVVVVGDLLVKTFRRVYPGVNPELDMLLFFAEHGFTHVPELSGWYAYEGERLQATLGLIQRFLPDAIDGWALGTAEAVRSPAAFLRRLHRLGTVVGEMHAVLASDPADLAFAPEDPTPESAGLLTARVDEEIDVTFDTLGDREEFSKLTGRRADAHALLGALGQSLALGRSIRAHGDLHLGQTLLQQGDWLVIDFEGEPTRSPSTRRQKTQPLRDVASMLRSFSYLAATLAREGQHVPRGWEEEAREQFLSGYRSTPVVTVLPATLEAQEGQLAIFELEKAFYEVRYEFSHRPAWIDIPISSITELLDRGVP